MNRLVEVLLFLTCLSEHSAPVYSFKMTSDVTCSDNEILIQIPLRVVEQKMSFYKIYNATGDLIVYVGNIDSTPTAECVAKRDDVTTLDQMYRLTIKLPFESCNTKTRILSETVDETKSLPPSIEYTNTVWWTLWKDNFVTIPIRLYDFKCQYRNKTLVKSAKLPVCCDLLFNTSMGLLQLEVNYWKSFPSNQIFHRPLVPPFPYLLDEILFVTVTFKQRSEKLFSSFGRINCHVSSSFQPADGYKVYVIQNGCPISDDFIGSIQYLDNNKIVFDFKVFSPPTSNYFYLHCTSTPCNSSCKPKCSPINRRGQSVIETASTNHSAEYSNIVLRATSGPILVLHKDRNKQISTKKRNLSVTKDELTERLKAWTVPLLIAVANIVSVILLGILCYATARSVESKRSNRFKLLYRENEIEVNSSFTLNSSA